MGRVCYMDGQFIPESELKISAYDLSVAQGAAAFEMTRSFNGVHFKLGEHTARLFSSCNLLGIPIPKDFLRNWELIIEEVTRLNDHGPDEEHRLLIVVSPGCADIYCSLDGVIPHPFVYIADFPLRLTVQGFSKYFLDGVHCVSSQISQVPDKCVPSSAKHRSRLHFHLAQQRAPEGTWPLMGTGRGDRGDYFEAPGANIVKVMDDTIYLYKDNALPGISMQTVAELAESLGMRVRDHEHFVTHGYDQEMFLTGTPFCLLPVKDIDGKPVGNSEEFPGPRYKKILAAWSELVGVDIKDQICQWDGVSNRKIWSIGATVVVQDDAC